MKSRLVAYGVFILAGFILGWQWHTYYKQQDIAEARKIAANTTKLGQLRDRITLLEAELKAEKTHSTQLEDELSNQNLAQNGTGNATNANTPASRFARHSSIPSVDTLTKAGIPLATAQAIRDQIAQDRMALLELRDRAEREGWIHSPRYAQALRKLLNPGRSIRTRFGDDIYDRYLYATGRPNRVVASVVYPNSAADAAGIQAGDIILRYGSENIYSMRDLQQDTLKGQLDESVLVVLQRNGSSFSITIPRGPLGIELKMKSEKPEN